MTDPKGQPGCLRERVERPPVRCRWTSVFARSAWDGSGTSGPSESGPLLCCRDDDTDYPSFSSVSLTTPYSGCCWNFQRGQGQPQLISRWLFRESAYHFEPTPTYRCDLDVARSSDRLSRIWQSVEIR